MFNQTTSRVLRVLPSLVLLAIAFQSACGSNGSESGALTGTGAGGQGGAGGSGGASGDKDVLSYASTPDGSQFLIDQTKQTIRALLVNAGGSDIQSFFVIPMITVSAGATIVPASGVKVDLLKPVTYTVTAVDGSTKIYVAELQVYDLPPNKTPKPPAGIPTHAPTADPTMPTTYVAQSPEALFAGHWTFEYSAVLEVRQVSPDIVYTLQEQTSTTQTTTVEVNSDPPGDPMTASGVFGWTMDLNLDGTYAGRTDQGDTSSGTWTLMDLGAAADPRYELKVDSTTIIAGGPSASGVQTWYIVDVYPHELYLTKDPITTSKSTTTTNVTLTR